MLHRGYGRGFVPPIPAGDTQYGQHRWSFAPHREASHRPVPVTGAKPRGARRLLSATYPVPVVRQAMRLRHAMPIDAPNGPRRHYPR